MTDVAGLLAELHRAQLDADELRRLVDAQRAELDVLQRRAAMALKGVPRERRKRGPMRSQRVREIAAALADCGTPPREIAALVANCTVS